ncbi:biliverdin-producing heme oxygenase [Calidifontimicrobium sp. SYSU G02091]|uniref:biliverdin-producing heme oxygenase n=1 Tax=Calidifontimicrobium sp. SYSU G02091 TaxID=2926421 RepID=UPI001F538316|nr:biliverdin-producing heme oxygenase [Calidifontimicrobium sp. SYSU G02091]MCI1190289.1 biliverdin-producing heme oxygenase [Calidifontimicrobium sp. SYSU G02091]
MPPVRATAPQRGPGDPDVPLSRRLREATHELHVQVERSAFIRALLRGTLPRAGHLLLMRNLHALYAALEAGLERIADDERLAPFAQPALRREAALAADLHDVHGPRWRDELALTPAMSDYVAHLQRLSQAGAQRLIAHAYVRYLGDLAGGQRLRAVVARALALPPGRALAFYDFGDAAEVTALARALRDALDALGRDRPVDDIVDEARAAFCRHDAVFAELADVAGAGLRAADR